MPVAQRTTPVVVLIVALLAVLLPRAAEAATDTGSESASLSAIDQERASRGLPALRRSAELQAVARRHAVRMADSGTLHHNPNLGSEVSGWRQVGENVGRGPDAGAVHRAFMESPSHRDNILSATFVEVGVGVERRGDTVWITQVFRLPSDEPAAAPTSEPAPTATATPAPRPTATAAPAPARPTPTAAPTSEAAPRPPAAGATVTPTEARIGPATASAIVPAPPPATGDRLVVLLSEIDDLDA